MELETRTEPSSGDTPPSQPHQQQRQRQQQQQQRQSLVVSAWRRVVHLWLACQVELDGQYSVHRMLAFDAYRYQVGPPRVMQLLFLTFVPCLLVEMLLEAVPLGKLDAGRHAQGSRNFWIRTTLGTYIVTHALVAQYRHNVYGLALSTKRLIVLSSLTTAIMLPLIYSGVRLVGFPFPFVVGVALVPWTPIVVVIAACLLRDQLRREPQILIAIRKYTLVFIAQSCLIVVYPAFSYLFNANPSSQTPLALLLPVIKLVLKNWFGYASRHIQDLKPELVVFNVEIFSALYVSSCMQTASSVHTTLVIMAVDFVQACVASKDLNGVLDDPQLRRALSRATEYESDTHSQYTTTELIPLTMFVLQTNAFVRSHASIQIRTCVPRTSAVTRIAPIHDYRRKEKITPTTATTTPRTQETRESAATAIPATATAAASVSRSSATVSRLGSVFFRFSAQQQQRTSDEAQRRLARLVSRLSDDEQLLVAQKTLQILHISEFVALVEYAEVFVPMVYSLFSVIAFTFPNRQAFAALDKLTPTQFYASLQNVLVYGSLEFVSFLVLDYVMTRKFQVSAFTQTAFVLEAQWPMVQAKLTLWMVALQFAHSFYGNDFTFQFQWLRGGDTSSSGNSPGTPM